jgi:aspartate kinase
MITLVQKYGGTSVETPDHLLDVARRILEEKRRGRRLLVVVSAMGQTTDELAALANRVSEKPPRREMDMLLTAGERISMALLAMALESRGLSAISFTGSQSGIITDDRHSDARIVEIRPFRIDEELAKDRVVIVAGFQGVSRQKEVTTLGRGGSDTTAVALAIHFGCPWCEIFTDVHGVLTADPRIVPCARTLQRIDHEPAIVLSHLGAQVLFRRAVILARKFAMPLRVRCSLTDGAETWIGQQPKEYVMSSDAPKPTAPMESNRILSVALEPRCVSVEIGGKFPPAELLSLIQAGPDVSTWSWVETQQVAGGSIVRGVCREGAGSVERLQERAMEMGAGARVTRDLAIVSLVGEGILSRPSLLIEAIRCLAEAEISIAAARSASLSLSFLLDTKRAEEAVRLLHDRFIAKA